MKYVLSIDVGGTFIKSALVNENLEILEKKSIPTAQGDSEKNKNGSAVAEQIAEILNIYRKEFPEKNIQAMSFATPGACDENAGIVYWAGNFGWENVPIKSLVTKLVDIPVGFSHDVRVGMVAEKRYGKAVDAQDAIFIPIGTGIAAALLIKGEIFFNKGFAGEIGHLKVSENRKCVCGKIGCLEAIASAPAIAANYFEKTGIQSTTPKIIASANSGDKIAQDVWQEAVEALGNAIEMLITILAPEKIIIGGGVSKANDNLLKPLNEYLNSRLTFQKKPEITLAHFGSEAGMIGNAIAALDLIN